MNFEDIFLLLILCVILLCALPFILVLIPSFPSAVSIILFLLQLNHLNPPLISINPRNHHSKLSHKHEMERMNVD